MNKPLDLNDALRENLPVALRPVPSVDGNDLGFKAASDLAGQPVPVREWLIKSWIPIGFVTALNAPGGTGKSLLAMQLQAAASMGHDFLGLKVPKVKTLGLYCEDDEAELHRRTVSIANEYKSHIADLADFVWSSRIGRDNTLATVDRRGKVEKTVFFDQLKQHSVESGSKLLVIDNIAHVFTGDENNRAQVTQFTNLLAEIAQATKGAVVLIGHPPNNGADYSGSTAWENNVRSRLHLERKEDGGGEVRVLSRRKANYAPIGDEIEIAYQDGAFVCLDALDKSIFTQIQEGIAAGEHEARFLACLNELIDRRENVSTKHGVNYAPRKMSGMLEAKGSKVSDLEAAMERLLHTEKIVAEVDLWRRKNSTWAYGIAPAGYEPPP